MDLEADSGAAARAPRGVRSGLVVATALAVATLVGAVPGLLPSGGGAGASGAAEQAAAPYGVAGCRAAAGAVPVDVAVTARALADDGTVAPSLGGGAGGPQVGASVRDLGGYAAHGVDTCEVVQVSVHLHDAEGGGTVPGRLEAAPRPPVAAAQGGGGAGELVALDWRSWESSLPAGARAGDLEEQAAWFVTLVDPVPGTYRLTGRVSTSPAAAGAAGDVEVLVEVLPAGALS